MHIDRVRLEKHLRDLRRQQVHVVMERAREEYAALVLSQQVAEGQDEATFVADAVSERLESIERWVHGEGRAMEEIFRQTAATIKFLYSRDRIKGVPDDGLEQFIYTVIAERMNERSDLLNGLSVIAEELPAVRREALAAYFQRQAATSEASQEPRKE